VISREIRIHIFPEKLSLGCAKKKCRFHVGLPRNARLRVILNPLASLGINSASEDAMQGIVMLEEPRRRQESRREIDSSRSLH
jgi:hypothetical protein